jgi:hypothetical protein
MNNFFRWGYLFKLREMGEKYERAPNKSDCLLHSSGLRSRSPDIPALEIIFQVIHSGSSKRNLCALRPNKKILFLGSLHACLVLIGCALENAFNLSEEKSLSACLSAHKFLFVSVCSLQEIEKLSRSLFVTNRRRPVNGIIGMGKNHYQRVAGRMFRKATKDLNACSAESDKSFFFSAVARLETISICPLASIEAGPACVFS